MKKTLKYTISIFGALLPIVSYAQTRDLGQLIDKIIYYLNQILLLMMAVAVVMFVFYIIKYFIRADAERSEASKYVMWSLIGFFVILSFWGLINIIQNTFDIDNKDSPQTWQSFTDIFPGGSGKSRSYGVPLNKTNAPAVDNFNCDRASTAC